MKKRKRKVDNINSSYQRGLVTDKERYRLVIKEWENAKEDMKDIVIKAFDEDNHVFMMQDSGARGNVSNFLQLAGMRGLMANRR